jgi:hypothetical protein
MNAPEPNVLERHCRLLLRAYPGGYRRDRGEEILGTLLERVAPGRGWPPPCEMGALILGGMRARAAQGRREGTAAGLRQAALLGVVLALSPHLASSLPTFTFFQRSELAWFPASINIDSVLFFGLAAGAIAMTWFWRPWAGAVLALAATPVWCLIERGAAAGQRWPVIIGLAGFALLAWSTNPPPRSWLLLPVAVIALQLAVYAANTSFLQTSLGYALQDTASVGFWVIISVVALWIAVDARPALAAAIALAFAKAPTEMLNSWHWTPGHAWPLLWPWTIAAGLAATATWRLWRHQARI